MSIKELPSMEFPFTLDLKGDDTGNHYQGSFVYKRPTIGKTSSINRTKALLNGGLPLEEEERFLHEVLAKLQHTLEVVPDWWKDPKGFDRGFGTTDMNVIFEVYRLIQKFETEWMDKVWGEAKPKSEEAKAQALQQLEKPN